MIPQDKLDSLVRRFDAVQSEMAHGVESDKYVALSKEFSELEPVVAKIVRLRETQADCRSGDGPRDEGNGGRGVSGAQESIATA